MSILFAVMLFFDGLAMGGPQASGLEIVAGWTIMAFFAALPVLVWRTKDDRTAAVVQAIPLLIAAVSTKYFVALAALS